MKSNSNCFSLRPAIHEEASLLYSGNQTDRPLSTMGHVRIGFDSSGKGFHRTWKPHNGERFNTPKFRETLQRFMDAVREDGPLKDLSSVGRFCRQNGGAITEDGWSYGYLTEIDDYRFCLRCIPDLGEYQCYLYCYDLHQQTLGGPVGRVSFTNGEHMEFATPQGYLRTIREEPPTKDGIGFLFEILTDVPAMRKAVGDMVYDLYGEENPRPLEDYVSHREPEMGGQQI